MKKKIKDETAVRISQTAHDLFMQFGIKAVSMDEIASKLGVAKKTLYVHFPDKESIVIDVVQDVLSKSRQVCESGTRTSDNALHELMLSLEHMYDLFRNMNPSLLFEMYKYYPKAYSLFKKHKEEFLLNMIKTNLKRGIREELYRPDLKVNIVAKFRLESIMIPFHPEFLNGLNNSLTDVAKEIATHFIQGIITPKGIKMLSKHSD